MKYTSEDCLSVYSSDRKKKLILSDEVSILYKDFYE